MKNKQDKYQEFKRAYETSGMTQKEFSKHKDISPSMVSYYLRKARTVQVDSQDIISQSSEKQTDFQTLELIKEESQGSLRLDLPSGITLTLSF